LPVIFTGAAGSTLTLAKDRKANEALTDIKIASYIKSDLIKKNFRELYAKVNVDVVLGRVLLTGTVDKEEDALTVVQVAWEQKGVNEVINELKADKNSNYFNLVQYTKDSLITSQIKSRTFLNRDIKFINFTVVTVNNVVYLFGISRSEDELKQVAEIAANVNGVTKVISHVQIKQDAEGNYSSVKTDDNDKFIIEDEEDVDQ
jgi:osmotically-inducible protein OsmY